MKKRTAELILKDPEKFAHHDRVFLNNPVVMQGMGLAPLVVVATTGQNSLMLAAAVALLLVPSRVLACLLSRLVPLMLAAAVTLLLVPSAGLPAQPPCTPAGRGAYPGAAAKKAAAPCTFVRSQRRCGVPGGISHFELRVWHRAFEPWHLPAHAGGGAASDLPLRPRAGDSAQGRFQGRAHHRGLRAAAARGGRGARVAQPWHRVRCPGGALGAAAAG